MIRRCGAWARPSGFNPPAAHAAWHAGTGLRKGLWWARTSRLFVRTVYFEEMQPRQNKS